MKNQQPSDKEIKFMEILTDTVQQFAECKRDEAMDFTLLILDKMIMNNIKIRKT